MGTDIHMFAQQKVDGKFQIINPVDLNLEPRSRYSPNQFDIQRNYALFQRLAHVRGDSAYSLIEGAKALNRLPNGTCQEIKKQKRKDNYNNHSLHILPISFLSNIEKDVFGFEDDMSYFEYEYWKKKDFLSLSHKFYHFYTENKLVSEKEMQKLITMENFHNEKPKVYCRAKYQYTSLEVYGESFLEMVKRLRSIKNDPDNIQLIYWFDN